MMPLKENALSWRDDTEKTQDESQPPSTCFRPAAYQPIARMTTMSSRDVTTAHTVTALILPEGKGIRTTPEKRVSLYDALEAAGYKNIPGCCPAAGQRTIQKLSGNATTSLFQARGNAAPQSLTKRDSSRSSASCARNKTAATLRHATLRIAMRFWDGDPTIAEEVIEQQDDPEVLKRLEWRARTKQSNKQLNDTILRHGGTKEGRENIYALVGGRNNHTVYGRTAKEIRHAYRVATDPGRPR